MSNPASPHEGWYKTQRSNGATQCVEVLFDGPTVRIRDSKFRRNPANSGLTEPMLSVTPAQWSAFLDIIAGRVNDSADSVLTATSADGVVVLESTRSRASLSFTGDEWSAFVAGARDGEFDITVDTAA